MGISAEVRTRRRVASSVVTCSPKQTRTKTNYGGRKKVGRVHASSLTRIIVGSLRDPSHLCSLHSRVGTSLGHDCPNVHMLTVPMATVATACASVLWSKAADMATRRRAQAARGKGDPIESRPIKSQNLRNSAKQVATKTNLAHRWNICLSKIGHSASSTEAEVAPRAQYYTAGVCLRLT